MINYLQKWIAQLRRHRLAPFRKPWMPEDDFTSIVDTVNFAVAFFRTTKDVV